MCLPLTPKGNKDDFQIDENNSNKWSVYCCCCYVYVPKLAQQIKNVKTILVVDSGWANNSVNTVIFRKTLYVLIKIPSTFLFIIMMVLLFWEKEHWVKQNGLQTTNFKGNVADAHNSISIITDGDGYLHLAWNHHGNHLHYCKSIAPVLYK